MGPVAHSGMGYLGWKLSGRRGNHALGLLFILLALLPDIDFVLAYLLPGTAIPHQLYTHNIFFVGFTAGLLLLLFASLRSEWRWVMAVGFSHLVLDLLVLDPVPPLGIKLLFPLWGEPLNLGFFPNLWRDSLRQILSLHNLLVVALEALVFGIPLWLLMNPRIPGEKLRQPR